VKRPGNLAHKHIRTIKEIIRFNTCNIEKKSELEWQLVAHDMHTQHPSYTQNKSTLIKE